jgi:hypothetical protein
MSNKLVRWMSYQKTWLYIWVTNKSSYKTFTVRICYSYIQSSLLIRHSLYAFVTHIYNMSNKRIRWMSYKKTWLYMWVTNDYGECLIRRLEDIHCTCLLLTYTVKTSYKTFTVLVCYSYIQSSLLIRHSPYAFVTHIYSIYE